MALKAMVKTLDGMTDTAKALYKADGDKFVLDVEPVEGFVLENFTGLKSALLKERENVATLSATAEKFKDIDPEKARDALKKVDAMKNWTPEEKAQELIERRGKEVAAQKDAEYAPVRKGYEAIRKAYESQTIDKALEDAAAKQKFTAPKLAAKLFKDSVRLDEKDGVFTPVVLDAAGKVALKINNDGTSRNLTIDEFVAEKAADREYAPLIAGSTSTGTGGTVPHNSNPPKMAPLGDFGRLDTAKQELAALISPGV